MAVLSFCFRRSSGVAQHLSSTVLLMSRVVDSRWCERGRYSASQFLVIVDFHSANLHGSKVPLIVIVHSFEMHDAIMNGVYLCYLLVCDVTARC